MRLIKKNEIRTQTLQELGINAKGLMADIMQVTGEGPMTCGIFGMDSPGSFEYNYTYEEFKIVLRGEIAVSDQEGNEFVGKPGDLFYFQTGDKVTFDTPSSGLTFYVSQREKL